MEQPRSIATCAPPPIDMWAPKRIADLAGKWLRGAESLIQSKI
jgi:hypothetical protein